MAEDSYVVLLIEDNPDHLSFEERSIQKLERVSKVVSAQSAFEAREKLHNQKVDLIILDYDLPDSDGLSFLEALMEEKNEATVVMVTGLGNERVAVRAMKLGAYDYVVKDKDYLKTLPDVIKHTLEKLKLSRSIKQIQAQLLESEERFQKLYQNANLGFVSINLETKKFINPNFMTLELTGYTKEEIENKLYYELVCQNERERIIELHSSLFNKNIPKTEGPPSDFEFWMIRKDGKKKYINCTATLFSQIGEVFLTLDDITDRKELEEKLHIAHEKLKNYAKELEDEVDHLKKRLIIEPALETTIDTQQKYSLDFGVVYLVKEMKPIKSYDIFKDFVSHGTFGLCISRTVPARIQTLYELEKTPVVWLSKKESLESSISGSDLGGLVHTIDEFIQKSTKSIVILDGLEYLITVNGFERTILYLNDMIEGIVTRNSILILPIHPNSLAEREMAVLERAAEVIELLTE